MGYKLAGFDVIGGVDIDPEMMKIYRINHKPRLSYLMGLQEFKNLPDLPAELFDLDILDGSPPCSSFSMAGSREKKWGEKFKFREGQKEQVLDDLFFHYIELAERLQPKVVIAENVKGLLTGNARGYVKEIFHHFDIAGYDVQLFLLNASRMGVPQARERTFFIARRKNLNWQPLVFAFNEAPIPFSTIDQGLDFNPSLKLTPTAQKYWSSCKPGDDFGSIHEKGHLFNWVKVSPDRPLRTLASQCARLFFHWKYPRILNDREWILGQTFPDDYFFSLSQAKYVIGMSVPPFMMQRIAEQLYLQWFLSH